MTANDPSPPSDPTRPLIGIVGVCGSGKSTLIAELAGYPLRTRHIAQEHSFVPDMWQRLTHPDTLIFLDASYPVTCLRRRLDWSEADYAEQQRRLRHARQHADLVLCTDTLSPREVALKVLSFLGFEL